MKKQGPPLSSVLGCLLGFGVISWSAAAQTTAPDQWAWMGGSNTAPQSGGSAPGVFGTLGSFSAGNAPGGRSGPAVWNDGKGHIWLFSGESLDITTDPVYLTDLWQLNQATDQWAWMGGTTSVPYPSQGVGGTYGTVGVPAADNIPGGREGAATWVDKSGNLWLFGGYGLDAAGKSGYLEDWWKFDPSTGQWTWMGGSSSVSSCPLAYGVLGEPNPANAPQCRDYPAAWTDSTGHFWMFGGFVVYSQDMTNSFGDMWELDPSTNEWAWMGGSDTLNSHGVYGTLGVASTENIPGARSGSAYWTDSSGNFWLFGGAAMNDLWTFNPTTKEWTWVSGSNTALSAGQIGTLGVLGPGNLPESRSNAVGWADSGGNFWIFGGFLETVTLDYEANDLWVFNPPSGQWAWMGGGSSNSLSYDFGVYGTLGIAAPGNWPTPREDSAAWTDSSGNLWLFGGLGSYSGNDLWEYAPSIKATLPTVATPTFSPAPGTYPYPQFGQIVISDATDGAIIYFTLNGSTPTTSSAEYNDFNQIFLDGPDEVVTAFATAFGSYPSAVSSATYHVTDNFPATVTVTPSVSSLVIDQTLTVTVTVNGSNAAVGPSGTVTLTSGSYSSAPATLNGANATIFIPPNSLVDGSNVLTVAYSGDFYYSPEAGTASVMVTPPPGITITGTAVTVAPGATTGNTSTVTVTPAGGFTGSVALTAVITSGPPGELYPPTVSFGSTTPVAIAGATAGTATLAISTTAATTSAAVVPRRPGDPWYAAGSLSLAFLLFVGNLRRRSGWRTLTGMLVLLAMLAGGVLACSSGGGSSGGGGGGGGTGIAGTTPGSYTVTVTATSGTITSTGTVALTVQ
jgi:hypothetical protein